MRKAYPSKSSWPGVREGSLSSASLASGDVSRPVRGEAASVNQLLLKAGNKE